MRLSFTKMNGAGNDFVMLDNREGSPALEAAELSFLCDRHRGIGADGVLVVEPAAEGADFRMRYYNADGGEAEMCGNGARCFARYASRFLPDSPESLTFETQAGIIRAEFPNALVRIAMSIPHSHRPPEDLMINGKVVKAHYLNTGVPHAVVFVEAVELVDVVTDGAALRHHPAFEPRGTNANFVEVTSPGLLAIRTYERGVENETLACGTGVTAAALLHHLHTQTPSPIQVQVRGGDLLEVGFTEKNGEFQDVTLTGPADFVFDGAISL